MLGWQHPQKQIKLEPVGERLAGTLRVFVELTFPRLDRIAHATDLFLPVFRNNTSIQSVDVVISAGGVIVSDQFAPAR